jgi:hypothetical protein
VTSEPSDAEPSDADVSDFVVHVSRQLYAGGVFLPGTGEQVAHICDLVSQIDRPAPILFQQRVFGFPAADIEKQPKRVEYVPMSLALTHTFPFDAHTHGYSVPSVPYRLRKPIIADCPADTPEPLRWKRTPVSMQWLLFDIDDPASHKRTGGTLDQARPEWMAEMEQKLAALTARHPRAFAYFTKKGCRILYRVEGWTIASQADEDRWCKYVLGCIAYLLREFGIDVDPCSRQWWNEFRLPFVRRNGVDQKPKTFGHPGCIGIWNYEPTEQDYEEADVDTNEDGTPKPRPASTYIPPTDPNAKDDLLDRAAALGILGDELSRGLKYAVKCPNWREHSVPDDTKVYTWNPSDSSTVIWRGGKLVCLHAHCRGITRDDLERTVASLSAPLVNLAEVEAAVHAAMFESMAGAPVLIKVTPGGGKSRAVRSSPHAVGGAIVTDTHALAAQTRTRLLEDHRRDFAHHASVTASIPGRETCAYPEKAREVQRLRLSVGRYLCAKCPKRDTCKAREPVGSGKDGIVTVHALVRKADPNKGVVIDEEPALSETRLITADMVRRAAGALGKCDKDFADKCGPWVRAWLVMVDGGADVTTVAEGIRAQANTAKESPDRRRDEIEKEDAARRAQRQAAIDAGNAAVAKLGPDAGPAEINAARAAAEAGRDHADVDGRVDHAEGPRLNRVWLREASALAAIRSAARADAKVTRQEGKDGPAWVVRTRSPALDTFATTTQGQATTSRPAPRVMLSATPSLSILRAVVPGLKVIEVSVPDGADITRVVVERSGLQTGKASEARILGCVDEALARARAAGCRKVFVACAMKFEEAVRTRAGTGVSVAHYGALRGLDDWMDCDAFVTVGDHFIEKGELEAVAAHFSFDAAGLWLEGVRNELGQAHGRARDPSRTTPCLHLHYGRVWPNGWSLENAVRVAAAAGRPKRGVDASAAREAVSKHGSVRKAAKALGIDRMTLKRRLAG